MLMLLLVLCNFDVVAATVVIVAVVAGAAVIAVEAHFFTKLSIVKRPLSSQSRRKSFLY